MNDGVQMMLRRTFWISLLVISALIFLSVIFRGQASTAVRAPELSHGAEKEHRESLADEIAEGGEKYQILQDIDPKSRLKVVSGQPSQSGDLAELFDGTLAPAFDPDPLIHDYDDLQFFTIIMSLNISEEMLPLRALVGVTAVSLTRF